MKNKKNLRLGRVKTLQETQDETRDPIESPTGILEGSKSSSLGSDTELEPALNKFFGGPPFCLILPDAIEGYTKPTTNKRPCKGRVQSSSRSWAIITWMDVLSEVKTADQFQRLANGMYWCRVKGRVVEMSAENYHFIALGYPQRMMQPTTGAMGKEDAIMEPDTGSLDTAVPDPTDLTRTSVASDLSHQSEKSTTMLSQGEGDIKGSPDGAKEFQDETARLRSSFRDSDLQSHGKQGSSGWAPIWLAYDPVRSEDQPIKSDVPTHIDDGGTGSSDVTKQPQSETTTSENKDKRPAAPALCKNAFIPWTPSPKKESEAQEGLAASTTSPRSEGSNRYSTHELIEGPAFIKSLIEAGTPWEEQEKLYKSKFGVSRSQLRLIKQFDLVDMKNGGFEKAAFRKRWSQPKSQATDYEHEKSSEKGKKRDPGPSDAA
ncbi:hypothetical protein PITC_032970 [Penicillium italicum]|uniref:Uncharacterized protein n=1 Tax=Penicillium italicum TaxID=40296 RepID=A0A0A2L9J3_PENIT|nr:hypothetical protein PITC_032970 [Penicillium italicum]